jgi:hypothetical protein
MLSASSTHPEHVAGPGHAEHSFTDDTPSVFDNSEGVARGADENEPGMGRPPFAETQQVGGTGVVCPAFPGVRQANMRASVMQTVPETPSPDALTVNKPDHLRRAALAAAAGRNVDEDSPGKGRVAKMPRTAVAPPPPAGSAYLNVCHEVRTLGFWCRRL